MESQPEELVEVLCPGCMRQVRLKIIRPPPQAGRNLARCACGMAVFIGWNENGTLVVTPLIG